MRRAGRNNEGDRSDADLVARIAVGESDAVGLLYDRYGSLLFALAVRITRDRMESEDVVHDAFIALIDRARQYDSKSGTVAAWFLTIVRNLCLDRRRNRLRRTDILRDRVSYECPVPCESPESLTARRFAATRLERGLATLAEIDRETLEQAFVGGLRYSEIAARQRVRLGTVKSRVSRALDRLWRSFMGGNDVWT